ncbi:NF-kappa-B-repressing factor-like isoform X2 [Branchiostoma floridae x Branchiostoma japonicum]
MGRQEEVHPSQLGPTSRGPAGVPVERLGQYGVPWMQIQPSSRTESKGNGSRHARVPETRTPSGGNRDLKTPSHPPHKRLKHIDLKKMINFKSGGVLGEEGRKLEEQPPMKQEIGEGGSFEASTFSVQPSSSSSMLGRDEVQQESGIGSTSKSSTVSISHSSPFVKPNMLSMNEQPSISPENCVQRSLLVRKKRFFSGLSEAVRIRFSELSRATENHVHVFTQCVQQCRANPLYKIVEVTRSSTFVLKTDRVDVPGYACDLYVEGVYLARGYGKGKVGAKTSAVKRALDRLRYHRTIVVATRIDSETGKLREEFVIETGKQVPLPPTLPPDQGLAATPPQKPKPKTGAWEPRFTDSKSLSDFVIYENAENAICILNSSAQFSKMNVTFDVNRNWRNGITMHQCIVRINQMIVADAWSNSSKDVKHLAAEAALSKLRQTNPVVKPKKAELTEDALTRTEVLGTKEAGEGQIKETNIGNQMLRKMGWSGGGIGKEGREGIAEPIKVDVMERRAGLGTATDLAEKQLISAKEAHQVIVNYVQSGREDDLVFSPELTSDERAAIHKMARRYDLQHKSYGKGQKRYLVIRRKRNAQDVMSQAQFRPGQYGTVVGDGKYEVTLPQSSNWQ